MLNQTAPTWRSSAMAVLLCTYGCSAGGSAPGGASGSGSAGSGSATTGTSSGASASAGSSAASGETSGVAAASGAVATSGVGATSGSDTSGATTGSPGSGVMTGTASGAGGSTGAAASGGLAASGGGAGADASASGAGQPLQHFVCTELIGLWVASQWWPPFYAAVDKAHWEFMFQHHGYLELFADPASTFWNNAIMSPCPMGSKAPDRIVFLPFSLTLKTLADWQTQLTKVVQTIQGKFPSAKRIELITTVRGPGNMTCAGNTDPDTVVAPYVDQAIQTIADQSGGLVTVGPKIEVGDCSWWAGSSHDLTGAGNTGVAQRYAAYYNAHP